MATLLSRGNVKPDGALCISAFPMGAVLNYMSGIMCSRTLRIWPNLAKALTQWMHQYNPDFKYTTMQLNRDYAAKMHVDGNNHGPSMVIALGDFLGGQLWSMARRTATRRWR